MKTEVGYTPIPDFQETAEDSLVEIDLNESTELWLIQLPKDPTMIQDCFGVVKSPDFDGQELSLDLSQGQIGSLEGSSGKIYNMHSYPFQASDATVFVASPSRPKIAGKIKRHVTLVHYPDPNELIDNDRKQKLPSSLTPSRSMSKRNPHSESRSRSSRKSCLSDAVDVSNSKSGKRSVPESSKYSEQSGLAASGQTQSGTTFSGSSHQSHKKSKQRKKTYDEDA